MTLLNTLRAAAASRRIVLGGVLLIVAGLLVTGLTGCARSGTDGTDGRLKIVATTSILADLARQVGGDRVQVEGLMGPGVDPHLYKASEGDVSDMAEADFILYNGLDLEGKMTDVFAEMRRRGTPVTELARDALPDSVLLESPDYAGNFDPHVWMDAELWSQAAQHLAGELAALDTTNADHYRTRAAAYADSLATLDAEIMEMAEQVDATQRVLITSHDAFRYYGNAYDFEVRGLLGISTAAEAGTADVQQLAQFVAEREIPALFVETSVPRRGIEAVQAAVRAQGFSVEIGGTLYGDALGSPGTPADTYIGMMRENTRTITSALLNGSTPGPSGEDGVAAR